MTGPAVATGEGVPAQVGRYRIDGVVGRGAMGVILRAHDPAIGRRVAVKLVVAELLGGEDEEEYLHRFRREAQAAGRLNHPNIVAVYDFGVQNGAPYLVMEFVEGTTLQDALRRGTRFAPPQVASIGARLLDALGCAHEAGIVHRDVKPANVMVSNAGTVKVADFGICRIEDAEATGVGSVVGTPAYMSPEQCTGDPVDARSDLFSAGVVLFELLSGARAFAGGTVVEITRRIVNGPTPMLPEPLAAQYPGLQPVISRALGKQRDGRYSTAREMADALAAAVGAPSGASPERNDETVVLPQASPGRVPARGATAGTGSFGADALALVSRRLAGHVGPIAGLLVQDAARGAGTPEALCDVLALSISDDGERRRFRDAALRELRGAPGGGTVAATSTGLPIWEPAQLDRARTALAAYLGPIARMLVDRAAKSAATEAELWDALARHVEDEGERAAFLRRR